MSKSERKQYLTVDAYDDAIQALHGICGMILLEFARDGAQPRDTIIRNFIARADMMSRAILQLWKLEDYQDCWILLRCLMDRLFHLHHLHAENQFELFEEWSFLQQYNARNRARSDQEFAGTYEGKILGVTPEQKERARLLSINPPSWKRPKPEEVAKQLDMRFLYRLGYDLASMHVHPMASDGCQDFFTITRVNKPNQEFPDQRSALSNALLVATMIVQEGLNASTLSWREVVYDFLGDIRRLLATGAEGYKSTFVKLGALFQQNVPLCNRGPMPSGGNAPV